MPSYIWCRDHQAFTKQCNACDELFIGAESQQESETIFAKNFGVGGRSNLDGFSTTCNLCVAGRVAGYNITHKAKKELFAKQNSTCPICNWPLEYVKTRIDHCHKTGRIRGLLHTQCNSQLGFVETNKNRILEYLKEPE